MNSSIAYSYRLNFIPPILNHNVTLFGDRVFEELTEVKLQIHHSQCPQMKRQPPPQEHVQ